MKRTKMKFCLALFLLAFMLLPAEAALTTKEEARSVASNWVSLVIRKTGGWGNAKTADVVQVSEFARGEKLLGYYCQVEPRGFVIVSLIKGLAPVKVYSEESALDLASDEGPTDLFKLQMEGILDAVEEQCGPLSSIKNEDLKKILDIDCTATWGLLNVNTKHYRAELESNAEACNYEQGGVLLTSSWEQYEPYNLFCPAASGDCPLYHDHCAVGCVATAGAQIMRYWGWPPYYFDWRNMPDAITTTSPTEQIHAVAQLCWSVGVAAEMDYCDDDEGDHPCASGTESKKMEKVFEGSFYSTDCMYYDRQLWTTSEEWWSGPGMIKDQISVNRPILYKIEGHAIVCDGWREWYHGDFWPEYHMNYGYGDYLKAWYHLDELNQVGGGTYFDEAMVKDIYPSVSLQNFVTGTYPLDPSFPYRYFDRDCAGQAATFEAGQTLQFLQNVTLSCSSDYIRILGAPGYHTGLITRGDYTRGISLDKGTIKILPGGCLTFR